MRRLIDDRHLLAARVDGVLKVPADFLRDGEPLPELRGTLDRARRRRASATTRRSTGCSSDEDSLGTTPIDALRAGRKAEVRRVAQALA